MHSQIVSVLLLPTRPQCEQAPRQSLLLCLRGRDLGHCVSSSLSLPHTHGRVQSSSCFVRVCSVAHIMCQAPAGVIRARTQREWQEATEQGRHKAFLFRSILISTHSDLTIYLTHLLMRYRADISVVSLPRNESLPTRLRVVQHALLRCG